MLNTKQQSFLELFKGAIESIELKSKENQVVNSGSLFRLINLKSMIIQCSNSDHYSTIEKKLLSEYDLILGTLENNQKKSPEFSYENIKKIKQDGNNTYISLGDSGVLIINPNGVNALIDTFQSNSIIEDVEMAIKDGQYKQYVDGLVKSLDGKCGISQVNRIEIDEYVSYKEYTLDDGEAVKINSHGVIDSAGSYYSFEEFRDAHKDKLTEDAYYEFNKYCVMQDTGDRLINPFNLNVNDIKIDDIITSLSGINRFAGQTKSLQEDIGSDFYTVGQHTLAMYNVIKYAPEKTGLGDASEAVRNKMAKQALLHEAFEGITGTDLITPFKYATKKNEYKIAEVEAESVMEKIFEMPLMTSKLKKIDKAMAATEGYYLVGQGNVDWEKYGDILPKEVLTLGLSQEEIKVQLKSLYEKEGLVETLQDYKYRYNKNLENDIIFKAKVEKYGSILDCYEVDDKVKVVLARQREKHIDISKDSVDIVMRNDVKLRVEREGISVIRDKDISIVDTNDFMFDHDIEDILKLDYEKKKTDVGKKEELLGSIVDKREESSVRGIV